MHMYRYIYLIIESEHHLFPLSEHMSVMRTGAISVLPTADAHAWQALGKEEVLNKLCVDLNVF